MCYDSYLKEYGLTNVYKNYLKALKKKAKMQLKYIETGDRFQLTLIELEERRLESVLKQQDTGITTDKMLIHLSRWVGYQLNSKKITAKEYFNIVQEYGKANKKE